MAPSHLVTLLISLVRNLDTEANIFSYKAPQLYDVVVITMFYNLHALWCNIDPENHIYLGKPNISKCQRLLNIRGK